VVSHDLKSPLASIVLTVEMLRENLGDPPDEGDLQLLNVLNRAAMKIRNLADGLLAYYRAERVLDEPAETFELQPVARLVAEMLKAGPSVSFHFPTDPVLIHANKAGLEQILMNLFQNAVRFSDKEQTLIRLGFREDAAFYQFEVEDNGRGIPEADQQRIFTLFTSLGDDHSGAPGLGIGLSVVSKLVAKAGGEIRVRSQPGTGSRFEFSIKKAMSPSIN
jgi:signal transduction histidine kinase